MAVRTLILDLGGVVCRYRPELRLDALAGLCGRTPEEVHRILYGSGFIAETELGRWTAGEIVAEVGARLGRRVGRDDLEAAWLASFPVDEDVLALAGRYRAALFTNNDLLLRETLLRAYPVFAERFGHIVFSAEIHAVKPAAEAFRRALAIIGCGPAEALFVDDSATNVDGALRVGLPAVRFRSAAQLAAELVQRV
jgi:putative hydrolase of the HAD superfamily